MGKEAAENTLSSKAGEEDFPAASKAILDRTDRHQSNFADKNNRAFGAGSGATGIWSNNKKGGISVL